MDESQVVLISNRGPVSFVEEDGGFVTKRGAGGLAGALDPVARRLGDNATWVVAATSLTDRKALAAGEAEKLSEQLGYRMYLIDIDVDTYDRYYDVVSNRMLWFANHCLWDELDIRDFGEEELAAWGDAYEPVNRRFAGVVTEVSEPDALILFQDYHLATAPAYLRSARPDQPISHFTHSSFCGPEGLERLPRPIPASVIGGMLGADLIGFHVRAWAEGFLSCCERIGAKVDRDKWTVDHDGRRSWVRAYPIPIDAKSLTTRAGKASVDAWAEKFRSYGRTLVVRADRAEPSKNIVRGFEAFSSMLDRRPDLVDRVRFVACLYPSRQSMPEYQEYQANIDAAVRKVNEAHPGTVELFMKDDFDRTLGALREYDVLVLNPLMDGMNLVAKEGPTLNSRSGVLVLSSGAGAFAELGRWAIPIEDPTDVEETSRAIERAIDLDPGEAEERAVALRNAAAATTPEDWIRAQIADLKAIRDAGAPRTDPPV